MLPADAASPVCMLPGSSAAPPIGAASLTLPSHLPSPASKKAHAGACALRFRYSNIEMLRRLAEAASILSSVDGLILWGAKC